MKKLLLALLLAFAPAALANQVIAPASGPVVPPEAVAAGLTALAFNSDFTTSFSSSCNGATNPQWYPQEVALLLGDCQSLTWPDTDPVYGDTVLGIHWSPNDPGSQAGRQGISTEDLVGDAGAAFPLPFYAECTLREETLVTPATRVNWLTQPVEAAWSACWGWQTYRLGDTGVTEFDLMELHSDRPNSQFSGGICNWDFGGCGAGGLNWLCPGGTLGGDDSCFVWSMSTYNPSEYHTYGIVVTAPPIPNTECGNVPCVKVAAYIDHNIQYTTWWQQDAAQLAQHTFFVITVTNACGSEGVNDCLNYPITGASNAGGNLLIQTGANCTPNTCIGASDTDNIFYTLGVGGNVPDGSYTAVLTNGGTYMECDPCTWNIYTYPEGVIVPYTGGYTGGGTFNPVYEHVSYVKSFRVFRPHLKKHY